MKTVKSIVSIAILLSLCACSSSIKESKEGIEEKVEEKVEKVKEEPKKEEKKEEAIKEEPIKQTSGMRQEVKEAIDSYETFIDEYIVFMQKYQESDDVTSMMMDYMAYMNKLMDFEEKMEKLDDDLNEEELKYYTEVMLRCEQKLLNAM